MHHNYIYSTAIESLPWWVILIIIGVILAIVVVIPWNKFSKKDKKTSEQSNDTPETPAIPTEAFAAAKPKQEKKPNSLFLGLYNGFGHKEAMRIRRLVYVYPEKDACELCQAFEGKVLSLEQYDNKYVTMAEAISKGYHHIGCKHSDIDFYPQETIIPKSPWTKKQQAAHHTNVLALFKKEHMVRQLTYAIDNKLSANIEQDKQDVIDLKQQIITFCEQNNLVPSEKRLNPYLAEWEKFYYVDEVITSSEPKENK